MLISLKPLPAYPDAYYPVTDNSDADSDRDYAMLIGSFVNIKYIQCSLIFKEIFR